MRVLVTGSRDWTDAFAIEEALAGYLFSQGVGTLGNQTRPVIIDGKCPQGGADQIAHDWATKKGYLTERYDANDFVVPGDTYKQRFWRRNKHMVDLGADVCFAFCLGDSRGTEMTIELARKAGIEVRAIYRPRS